MFRLVRRDQSFVVEGLGDAAEFRSALHDDGVRRVWFIDSASFTGSATEKGTMRSFGRLLGHVFGPAPVHLIVPLSLVIADDAGPAGSVRSRRTLPVGYAAEAEDRVHPLHLAALTVLISSASY